MQLYVGQEAHDRYQTRTLEQSVRSKSSERKNALAAEVEDDCESVDTGALGQEMGAGMDRFRTCTSAGAMEVDSKESVRIGAGKFDCELIGDAGKEHSSGPMAALSGGEGEYGSGSGSESKPGPGSGSGPGSVPSEAIRASSQAADIDGMEVEGLADVAVSPPADVAAVVASADMDALSLCVSGLGIKLEFFGMAQVGVSVLGRNYRCFVHQTISLQFLWERPDCPGTRF